MLKEWYRAKEVAKYLGISLAQVWLLSKEGKLKNKKLSSRITVFNIKDIEALFDVMEVS